LTKKGEDDANYFVALKQPKQKGNARKGKGGTAPPEPTPAAPPSSEKFRVSLQILTALASLSIPAPSSAADVPQIIQNLKIKREWFLANQERQTELNKAQVEKEIEGLLRSMNDHGSAKENVYGSSPESLQAPVDEVVAS